MVKTQYYMFTMFELQHLSNIFYVNSTKINIEMLNYATVDVVV